MNNQFKESLFISLSSETFEALNNRWMELVFIIY